VPVICVDSSGRISELIAAACTVPYVNMAELLGRLVVVLENAGSKMFTRFHFQMTCIRRIRGSNAIVVQHVRMLSVNIRFMLTIDL